MEAAFATRCLRYSKLTTLLPSDLLHRPSSARPIKLNPSTTISPHCFLHRVPQSLRMIPLANAIAPHRRPHIALALIPRLLNRHRQTVIRLHLILCHHRNAPSLHRHHLVIPNDRRTTLCPSQFFSEPRRLTVPQLIRMVSSTRTLPQARLLPQARHQSLHSQHWHVLPLPPSSPPRKKPR